MSMLQTLTEGIRERSVSRESEQLVAKWEATGLLEGLTDENRRSGMARLLENQAAQLLKEESSMGQGGQDVEGFAAVAFPIVRRVFGGLIAQDVVSVQPMSLPSGLVFYMDFTRGTSKHGDVTTTDHYSADESVYGGRVVAKGLQTGTNFTNDAVDEAANGPGGFYGLHSGYGSGEVSEFPLTGAQNALADDKFSEALSALDHANVIQDDTAGANIRQAIKGDPDLIAHLLSGSGRVGTIDIQLSAANFAKLDKANLTSVNIVNTASPNTALNNAAQVVRRLTKIKSVANRQITLVIVGNSSLNLAGGDFADGQTVDVSYATADPFTTTGAAIGGVLPTSGSWLLEDTASGANIAEIDLKVDSVAVTAVSKKLKAKWTPELAQDLNAYHSVDAEVELTSVLSEMIALEIDQEILGDLISQAAAGTYHWSRKPGQFMARDTSNIDTSLDFTGTVSEWYQTLLETINDLSAVIHRKTLRGGANFLVCSPDVAAILEFTSAFRASVGHEDERGSWGAEKVGTLSNKMDIYVDPYFPRQVLLVGRKGNSFLESGYVYAPYVPLQVTPTILDPDTFKPRKGVMTRYAKEMVRADMYGVVVCHDLLLG